MRAVLRTSLRERAYSQANSPQSVTRNHEPRPQSAGGSDAKSQERRAQRSHKEDRVGKWMEMALNYFLEQVSVREWAGAFGHSFATNSACRC